MPSSSLKAAQKVYTAPLVRNQPKSAKRSLVGAPKLERSKSSNEVLNIDHSFTVSLSQTNKWRESLKLNDLSFLCSNINSIYNDLSKNLEAWLDVFFNFFCDYVGAVIVYLESVNIIPCGLRRKTAIDKHNGSKDCEDDVQQLFQLASQLCMQSVLFVLQFFKAREDRLDNLLEDFEAMEEELSLYREILSKLPRSGSSSQTSIEIVVRQTIFANGAKGNAKSMSLSKSTMTESLPSTTIMAPTFYDMYAPSSPPLERARGSFMVLDQQPNGMDIQSDYYVQSQSQSDNDGKVQGHGRDRESIVNMPRSSRVNRAQSILEPPRLSPSSFDPAGNYSTTSHANRASIVVPQPTTANGRPSQTHQFPNQQQQQQQQRYQRSSSVMQPQGVPDFSRYQYRQDYGTHRDKLSIGVGDSPSQKAVLETEDEATQTEWTPSGELKRLQARLERVLDEKYTLVTTYEQQIADLKASFSDFSKATEEESRRAKAHFEEQEKILQFKNESLETSLSHLSDELSKVRNERQEILEQNLVRQEEVRILQNEMATLRETQQETQALADSLEMNLCAVAEKNKELRKENEITLSLKADTERRLDEALAQMLTLENEKGRLSLTVDETSDSFEKTKIRMGDLHHQLVITKEDNERLEDEVNAIKAEFKVNEYKVRELQMLVDTMMKYPDASLGLLRDDGSTVQCT
ncbi:hypothetical protein HDU97_008488 [Phlyctochytrium planicorne]|nr:hypothetical protein HDU97_008488 [Phlyctochytrium planicorne]